VIHEANEKGIKAIVDQQFEIGQQIADAGFVPILEPEVDIHSTTKKEAEKMMLDEIEKHLKALKNTKIMLKLSIPTVPGFYSGVMKDPSVVRVVALSGGYTRQEADELLKKNPGLIASFSRALLSDLNDGQTQPEFDAALTKAIKEIYAASIA
ncbi:MAG: class I fructose-bisphosphate aldolase, partial [Bacteroidales bacterium]